MKVPYNEEAEKAVLGAMIENDSFRAEALGVLVGEDLYCSKPNHRYIFEAISNLVNGAKVVDMTSITEELLNNMKVLDETGGVDYLIELRENYLGEQNSIYHLNTVRDLALLRRLLNEMKGIIDDFSNSSIKIKSISQFIAEAEKRILDITKTRRVAAFQDSADVLEMITNKLKIRSNRADSFITGVDTGFQQLNKLTQGFQPGDLIILAARPSVGKTAFAINLAYNAAAYSGKTVAFFSLEMTAEKIVQRLLASRAQINSMDLNLGKLRENDWLALSEAVESIKSTRILIDDTSAANINDIRTKAKKLKAQDENFGLMVIDYLGLITTNMKTDSRQQEVAEISRQLKALARELEVPVLCLCQLSRASEKRTDKTPVLSDLRDSGSIEQDADQVMFIYRPNYQNTEAMRKEEEKKKDDDNPLSKCEPTHIVVSKNRNGQTGIVYLNFLMNISRFAEMDMETINKMKEENKK